MAIADYDADSDSLAVSLSGKKSSGAIEMGDIIVDFDHNRELAGIELLNASDLLTKLTGRHVTSATLQHIETCELQVKQTSHTLVVTILLRTATGEITTPIAVPALAERQLAAA